MSIGATTIVLFAGFCPAAVCKLPHFRQHCNLFHCCGCFLPVLGSDHFYHHAEDEQRRGKFLSACNPALYFSRKHYE